MTMASLSNHCGYKFDDSLVCFSVNSQRPPVPGEEDDESQKRNSATVCDRGMPPTVKKCTESSPSPIVPRRATHDISVCSEQKFTRPVKTDACDAPLGFEPEGSTSLASNFQESSNSGSSGTASCLKWAENFNHLLQDSDGVKLFKEFLIDQDENCSTLDFWFACRGLKMVAPTDTDRTAGLVKLIYKKYIKGDGLRLKSDVKRRIVDRLKKERIDRTIFDEAQTEVENAMRSDSYPLFLKSDIYLLYVQAGEGSPKQDSILEAPESGCLGSSTGKLTTLYEGEELCSDSLKEDGATTSGPMHFLAPGPPRVRNGVPSDRYHRVPCPVATKPRLVSPYHVSYAPVSAQDSELQSLSSDALTDDTLSYTDSSVDGREYASYRNKLAFRKQVKAMRHSASANQQADLNQHFIPRTEIVKSDCNLAEKDPLKFSTLLNERLLKVKEEQDRQERFLTSIRSIQGTEDEDSCLSTSQLKLQQQQLHRLNPLRPSTFNSSAAAAAAGSFALTSMLSALATTSDSEDNAQSILDDHVSHIWNSSGPTPSRSPGRQTPDHCHRHGPAHASVSAMSKAPGAVLKTKDVGDALAPVSGIVRSSAKQLQHAGKELRSSKELELLASPHQWRHSPVAPNGAMAQAQSKSVSLLPSRCLPPGILADDGCHGNRQTVQRGDIVMAGGGLGKVEAGVVEKNVLPSTDATNERVLMWMLENEKYGDLRAPRGSTDCSDRTSSHKHSSHKSSGKRGSNHRANRSESLDRNPIAATLPSSDFALGSQRASNQQMAGVRPDDLLKRLASDEAKMSSHKTSWMPKTKSSGDARLESTRKQQDFTVVGYYFCDEPIPYRTTIPGKTATLGQLKLLIAKKGSYRYYFKKVSDEFDSGVVHEELANDADVLPLWDGKVVCKVERLLASP